MANKTPVKQSVQKSKSHVPLTPLHDKVVVKPLTQEELGTTTALGIIIPDTAKEKPEQGVVVAVGPGKWNEDGEERVPVSVSVGDRVLFGKYGYETVKLDGVEYYIISESNISAIITK